MRESVRQLIHLTFIALLGCQVTAASETEVAVPGPIPRVVDAPEALLRGLKQNEFLPVAENLLLAEILPQISEQWNQDAERFRRENDSAADNSRPAQLSSNGLDSKAPHGESSFGQQALIEAADAPPGETGADAPSPTEGLAVRDPYAWLNPAWQQLQSDAGVETLVDTWQPILAPLAAQRLQEFNDSFARLLNDISSDPGLSVTDVEQLTKLMYAAQDWASRVDFGDRERLRRAVLALARFARATDLEKPGDVRAKRFEEVILLGDDALRAGKQILGAYDIDANAILNSVILSEVDAQGDLATLRVQLRVLGVDLSHDIRKRYYRNAWVDEDTAAGLEEWSAQQDLSDRATVIEPVDDATGPSAPNATYDSPGACAPET